MNFPSRPRFTLSPRGRASLSSSGPAGADAGGRYDAVVVGAGPGGSVAARLLAAEGFRVLLLEKRPAVGVPVRCGEAAGSRSELARFVPVEEEWISSDVHGIRFVSPGGRVAERRIGEIGTVLDRSRFDAALARAAAGAGAELRVGTMAVGLLRDGKGVAGVRVRDSDPQETGPETDIAARVVIGADGVESQVGRWAGLDRGFRLKDIHSCAQVLVEGLENTDTLLEVHVGRTVAPGGYGWVFPKGPGRANLGVGIHPSLAPRDRAADYLGCFRDAVCPGARVLGTVVGGTTGSAQARELAGAGVVLVGEAARQNNPFSGGGIMNAMEGAEIAAEETAGALRAGAVTRERMAGYRERWMNHWGRVNDRFLRLRKVFLSLEDDDLDLAIEIMGEITGRLQVGAIDYVRVFADVLRHHPRLLLKARHYF
jgi:digeranylgeranylglycerophospholipid reductase